MAYAIEFTPRARRELGKLPSEVQEHLVVGIEALALDPRPPGVRKLTGEKSAYRIRIGDYRVLYEIRDSVLVVVVMRAGHRRDVYR